MRARFLVPLSGIALACSPAEAPTAPFVQPAFGAFVDHASFRDQFPIAGITTCTGDPFSGSVQTVTAFTDLSTPKNARTSMHTSYTLEGASLGTGRRYIGSGEENWSFAILGGDGLDYSDRWRSRLIAQGEGPADDLTVTFAVRFHLDANGILRQDFFDFQSACQ